MSWSQRGNGNSGSWGRGKTAIPSNPASVTVLIEKRRMAIINAYDKNSGERAAAVHLCELTDAPEVLTEITDTAHYGIQAVREFVTVGEAIQMAKDWLSGKTEKPVSL